MMKTRLVVVALLSLALALPAFGKTYKSTYPVPCSDVWGAVKDTLSNPENYDVVESDDSQNDCFLQCKARRSCQHYRSGPPANQPRHLGIEGRSVRDASRVEL